MASPAAPPTTPPAIVPAGGTLLSVLLLCWTPAPVLLEGDASGPCAGLPAAYAVDVSADPAVLDADETPDEAVTSLLCSAHCVCPTAHIVKIWPSAKVVLYGLSDRVSVTTWSLCSLVV